MPFPSRLNQLCTPALLYFFISIFGLIIVAVQNLRSNMQTLRLGDLNIPVPNLLLIFIVKLITILFWTWVLNLICRDGHNLISWILVLFPFIVIFLMYLMMLVQ